MNGNGINGNGVGSREVQNVVHQKQNRMQVQKGLPNINEMSEAVPVLRAIDGVGIVEYIKYNGDLYASHFVKNKALPIAKGDQRISKFHDGLATGGAGQDWSNASSIGASPQNEIGGKWEDTDNDLASLVGKVNEIIKVLRFAGILEEGAKSISDGG